MTRVLTENVIDNFSFENRTNKREETAKIALSSAVNNTAVTGGGGAHTGFYWDPTSFLIMIQFPLHMIIQFMYVIA